MVRSAVVTSIARLGDPDLLDAVLPLLDDKNDVVRFTAAATQESNDTDARRQRYLPNFSIFDQNSLSIPTTVGFWESLRMKTSTFFLHCGCSRLEVLIRTIK